MEVVFVYSERAEIGRLRDMLGIPCMSAEEYIIKGWKGVHTVIRWGAVPQWSESRNRVTGAQPVYELNSWSNARTAADPDRAAELLRLHGMPAGVEHGGEQGTSIRKLCVYVFHLEAIAVYRTAAKPVYIASGRRLSVSDLEARPPRESFWTEVPEEEQGERSIKRAVKGAVRAVYSLGLDYGMVNIAMDPKGNARVERVEPFPSLNERLSQRYAEAMMRFRLRLQEEFHRQTPVMLGADPEFLLENGDGKIVPASVYLPKRGKAGCDILRIRDKVMYPLAELRPPPGSDPRSLLIHVRRALVTAAALIPDDSGIRWLAGGMPAKGFALGGHIHMSGLWLTSCLLRVLDNYAALPLMLIEDERTRRRRPRYGYLGDFRRQPHGGFEYRTLPSWLVSPRVAKAAIALAALAAEHYWQLKHRPLADPAAVRAYYDGDKQALIPHVQPLLEELRVLSRSTAYESYLTPLFRMIERGETWDERKDIRSGWKIGAVKQEAASKKYV